jgi:hypothetical protein
MAPWKFAWPELDFAPHASPEIEAMLKAAPVLPFDELSSAGVEQPALAPDDLRVSALAARATHQWREEQERGWRLDPCRTSRGFTLGVELSGDGAPRLNRRLPLWVERPPKLLVTRPRAPSNTLTAAIPSKRCQIVATASMRTPSMFV